MKILFVAPGPPSPHHSGTGIRLFNTLRALSYCADVTLVTLVRGRDESLVEKCEPWCRKIVIADPERVLRVKEPKWRRTSVWEDCWNAITEREPVTIRIRDGSEFSNLVESLDVGRFDLIWVAKNRLAGFLPWLDWKKVIVDFDDLEYRVEERMLRLSPWYPTIVFHYVDAWKERVFEWQLCKRVARVLVCSEKDRRRLKYENVRVLPNCVDLPERHSNADREIPCRLLFVGKMNYAPNVDAASYFCKDILPQIRKIEPRAHVCIVGREPNDEVLALHTGEDVIVTGSVPHVTPYFHESGVVIVPLRAGGGTRVKILEAFAHGKAVVSTTIGAEGLDVQDGVHLYLEDTPTAFAEKCLELINNAYLRQRMGAAGRQLVEARYCQSVFDGCVHDLVSEVVGSL